MINYSTGDGLSIIIDCDDIPIHNWMGFASWYSIYKNLPDAKTVIACKWKATRTQYFSWTGRCKVKCFKYYNDEDPKDVLIKNKILKSHNNIIIKPFVIVLREYDGNNNIINSKSDESGVFIDYSAGCGRFEMEFWKDKNTPPFRNAVKRFNNGNLSVNELKILKFWEKCEKVYYSVL